MGDGVDFPEKEEIRQAVPELEGKLKFVIEEFIKGFIGKAFENLQIREFINPGGSVHVRVDVGVDNKVNVNVAVDVEKGGEDEEEVQVEVNQEGKKVGKPEPKKPT